MSMFGFAIVALAFIASAGAQGNSTLFPPGFNGEAMKPPMGWRSWNAFGARINNATIVSAIDALTTKKWDVEGFPNKVSLADLGYLSAGIDEGWENCSGSDPNHGLRQHDVDGFPMVDTDKFPDLKWLVDYGHTQNIQMGWYLNGCACGERKERALNYQGDVQRLHEYGFDSAKFDGCGAATNMTYYAELMQATGRSYAMENCHWGTCGADKWYHNPDGSSCPTQKWAPFNWYRTSGDINSGSESWLGNLQTTIRFQDYNAPLSKPGVWAYPDMLEVGRVREPVAGTFYTWNRAHFGAWCVISAPLILGLELTDANIQPVLDIITNTEAIKVNQQWSGHPGLLVENIAAPPVPPVPYDPKGAVVPSSSSSDFNISQSWTLHGPSITTGKTDKATSGKWNIRSGHPGDVALIPLSSMFLGKGHALQSLSMSFRYVAGYPGGPDKKASSVRVLLLDMATKKELSTLLTTGPLGEYNWDNFTGYSPPIKVNAQNLSVPNDAPVILALEVTHNDRNLQIPIDDLSSGMDIHVTWSDKQNAQGKLFGGLPGYGQLWAKPQPGGAVAALVINHSPYMIHDYALMFEKLNLTTTGSANYEIRDLWARTNNGSAVTQLSLSVPPYDSAFLLLSPSKVFSSSSKPQDILGDVFDNVPPAATMGENIRQWARATGSMLASANTGCKNEACCNAITNKGTCDNTDGCFFIWTAHANQCHYSGSRLEVLV